VGGRWAGLCGYPHSPLVVHTLPLATVWTSLCSGLNSIALVLPLAVPRSIGGTCPYRPWVLDRL